MPFNLIDVNAGGSIVNNDDGTPMIFEDGRAAATAAAAFLATQGRRVQPRRVMEDDNAWKQREQARFDNGTYRRPLFVNEEWFRECRETAEHFLHVSTENPANVAFTADAANGHADRQTSMRVGRYLEQFFGSLPREYRERLTREHTVEFVQQQVQITQEADRIEWIYRNGPHSCMAYPPDHFSTRGVHPTAVYAGPDLAIAYLLSEGDDSRVAARAVCWPDRQRYGRVYGDMRLASLLERRGWTSSNDFEGARLRKITFTVGGREGVVAPYFDAADHASDAGDHLVINRNGNLQLKNTNGTAYRIPSATCACCNTTYRENATFIVHVDFDATTRAVISQRWCSSCHTARRDEVTRSSRYGSFALRANGTMRSGVFWFNAEWDATAAQRQIEEQRIAREMEARRAREAEEVARQERRIATRAARRARHLATQGDELHGTFVCPVDGTTHRWEHGVDVRSINADGSITSQRWSQENARLYANRCRITRYLYRREDLVFHDDTRMNLNTARLRGWVNPLHGLAAVINAQDNA